MHSPNPTPPHENSEHHTDNANIKHPQQAGFSEKESGVDSGFSEKESGVDRYISGVCDKDSGWRQKDSRIGQKNSGFGPRNFRFTRSGVPHS